VSRPFSVRFICCDECGELSYVREVVWVSPVSGGWDVPLCPLCAGREDWVKEILRPSVK